MNVGAIINVRKCRHCKEPAGTAGRCAKHNDAHKADQRRRIAERRAAGLCQCGGVPVAGLTICEICQARNKRIQRRKRAAGNCIRCAMGNRAVAAGMCRCCWFKKIASECLKSRGAAMLANAQLLEILWDSQSGRCALTGETLTPGVNASLDHRVPQSQGGSHEISNLQWVTFAVNMAKHALCEDEFLALCRRVIAHQERL